MPDDKRNKERKLVLRLIDDDHEAFQELYVRYRKSIFLTAYSFIRSTDFAGDIYQDTFTTIWQIRKSLEPDLSFSAFVFTIARNTIFQHLRQIRKNQRLTDCLIAQLTDVTADSSAGIVADDLSLIVDRIKENFNYQQRIIFELSRNHDLTHQQIANILDISTDRVNYILSKSLKSIRLSLAKYGIISILLLMFSF